MSDGFGIGIVADSHYPRIGGMEHENHWLASAFCKLPDLRVAVACSTMPEVPRDFPYPYPVFRHRSLSILTDWLAARSAGRMIAETRADILHGAMLHGGGFRAIGLGQRFGLPVAVRAHGSDLQIVPEIGYGARLDSAAARRVDHTLRYADFVSVPCERLKHIAIELGATACKVAVVPPGTDSAAIATVPYEDMRARHGIAPGDMLLVTVGRNRPIKRLELLFGALRNLASEMPNLRCFCVGPEEDLPVSVRRFGLERVVVRLGPIHPRPSARRDAAIPAPDLVNIYRAADAYVSTSYIESFGLAALEAMACGTPALVMRGHGVEDAIVEGINGIVVDDPTSGGVAAGLWRMLAMKLSNAREKVRASVAHLEWDRTARRLSECYREVHADRALSRIRGGG